MYFLSPIRASVLSVAAAAALIAFTALPMALAVEAPQLVKKDGRYALMVEGRPYLILGGQIHNSSAWPSELPQVWQSMAALHANTMEAPVYWEQMEPQEGQFNFTNVNQLVEGARAHNLHVVLLWFGTWKNGNMHYVPSWVKNDPKRFPHTTRPDGEPIDVLSANSRNNLEADRTAFVALMHHLKQIDSEQHTVLLIQVENEAGNIGSVRDNSTDSNMDFAGQVPADLLAAAHKQPGTWSQVFGPDADEIFQVYHQAKYINEIVAAGKAEFDLPMYINVWLDYSPLELPGRPLDLPGSGYPSGGAVRKQIGLWRALAPAIDMIGPDIYADDYAFYRRTMSDYHRPDNPLWIPETGLDDFYGSCFFYALGEGAIGFSPFGIDQPDGYTASDQPDKVHARNYVLIGPMSREIAQLEFDGKLRTAVQEPGQAVQELDFGAWQATVVFGPPQIFGGPAPDAKDAHGAALVAQLGPDEFLVTGIDARVVFHLLGKLPDVHSQVVSAEQGAYDNGIWKPLRLLNGDEGDNGTSFSQKPEVVRVRLGRF